MSQRPSIKQPKPLTATPVEPSRVATDIQSLAANPMLGEMQAEVSPEAAPLWHFVLEHAQGLALAVVGIIVLIIGVAIWQWQVEGAAEDARMDLGKISATQNPQTRMAALEKFSADAPASVATATKLELAASAAQAQDWGKAAAAYAAVADAEGDSSLGFTARLNEADILLRQGKAAEALPKLEALLAKTPDTLKSMLNQQIAEAAEAAGQKDKAIAAYEAAIKTLPPSSEAEISYYQSRIAHLR